MTIVLERPLPQVAFFNSTAALRNTYIHPNYSWAIELNNVRCVLVLDCREETAELRTSCSSRSRILDRACSYFGTRSCYVTQTSLELTPVSASQVLDGVWALLCPSKPLVLKSQDEIIGRHLMEARYSWVFEFPASLWLEGLELQAKASVLRNIVFFLCSVYSA